MSNKISDKNVGSIEKDIKRCEKLTEPQNANWIGISNQLAIAHVVDRVQELEAKLEFKSWGDLDNTQFEEYMNQFIPKQKVKEGLEDIEYYFDRLNGPDEDIEYIRRIKKELLEDK